MRTSRLCFAQVTGCAGKTKIVQVVAAFRIDMLHMHGLPTDLLARLAIFAAVIRTLVNDADDLGPRAIIHGLRRNLPR